ARIALEEELPAVLRDLAVVHHHPQLARARIGAEPGEDERQVQVADPDLDRAAERAAREECVAPDAVRGQLVAASGDEPDTRLPAEVADDVPHHGELLARLDLGAGLAQQSGRDIRATQAGRRSHAVLRGEAQEKMDARDAPSSGPDWHQTPPVVAEIINFPAGGNIHRRRCRGYCAGTTGRS